MTTTNTNSNTKTNGFVKANATTPAPKKQDSLGIGAVRTLLDEGHSPEEISALGPTEASIVKQLLANDAKAKAAAEMSAKVAAREAAEHAAKQRAAERPSKTISTKPAKVEMPERPETFASVEEEVAFLRAQNAALKARNTRGISIRVSEKGAVSIYGLGRFPVTLYKEQMRALLGLAPQIEDFMVENDAALKNKGE